MNKLPNIILIVCDTLGARHMSLYGYYRKTTPNIERLVEEEGFTVYKNCYSTSCWTPPAHASLFTGLYPQTRGTWSNFDSRFKRISQEGIVYYEIGPYDMSVLEHFKDLYDEELLYLDGVLYSWYQEIKSALVENSLFIITSDHGENFGEDGHFGHILSLTEAVCHVPLLVKYPWNRSAEYSERLCQINDLLATIQEITNSPFPIPNNSVSLLSSDIREKALMEILSPEGWLNRVKNKERFKFCFKMEKSL